jgi:hypothetical protein
MEVVEIQQEFLQRWIYIEIIYAKGIKILNK